MTGKLPDSDRRVKTRLPIVLEVEVAWRGGDFVAFSVDLAEAGIFLQTEEELPVGTEARLRFGVPGRACSRCPVVADGLIRRAVREGGLEGLAVAFERFVEGRQALQELIHNRIGPGSCQASTPGGERRRAPRMNVGISVYWGVVSPPRTMGFLSDLSDTGAFVLETDNPAAVGQRIFLEFELPFRKEIRRVKVIAKVVRRQMDETLPCGMGIEFEYSTVDAERIRRFITQQRALESLREQS